MQFVITFLGYYFVFRNQLLFLCRKSESVGSENRRSQSVSSSPAKEDRFYTTRGSLVGCEEKENGNLNEFGIGIGGEDKGGVMVLPRFFVSLSNKEKEEDFMAMKGCKLPQRPKKRSKYQQNCLLVCINIFLIIFISSCFVN